MLRRPDKSVSSGERNVKCTFWHFNHSRSEHEASLFRKGPSKTCRWNLLRNSECLKTVLYSELQPILIENVIMLTLVENRRREVVQVQGPRSGFWSGEAKANAWAGDNQGSPGACSPGKKFNLSLLKWLEMYLKLM